jgi:uncharacterized repeat protein (TIGR03803 family)
MNSTTRLAAASLCAALAACSRQSLPIAAPMLPEQAASLRGEAAAPVSTVYTFKGGTDGISPTGDLIWLRGSLYGTTASGGSTANLGTVFALTTQGGERVVYRFTGGPNVSTPNSGLVSAFGKLYGVSSAQLFSLSRTGASFSTLFTFNAASAEGPLATANGRVYGVERFGGDAGKGCTDDCGSAFAADPAGAVQTIYTFRGGSDGGEPGGGLISVKGTLYGTTLYGGTHNAGTVFSLTASGAHRVLFSFNPKTDGAQPRGKLYQSGGVLYGTTEYGGKNDSGTMFAVTLSGKATILHQFGASGDASNPNGSLVEVKRVFYGTSSQGGTHNGGTVFAVNRSGAERVVYSFVGTNTVQPGLINVRGTLYGSTATGGKGNGTIFKVKL